MQYHNFSGYQLVVFRDKLLSFSPCESVMSESAASYFVMLYHNLAT